MKCLVRIICEEVGVKNYFIQCGKDEEGNVIGFNYEHEGDEWTSIVGEIKKPVKNMELVEKLFLNSLG